MRHQRDLFTGSSLGIPDVNTHVGSVIHAFETMAIERNLQHATDNLVRQKPITMPPNSGMGEFHHDPIYGQIPKYSEYYIEKSVDDTTITTTETSSNLDGASYIIDDNYRKSGFGAKPSSNPIACQTNTSRIPTMIKSERPTYEIVKNATVQSSAKNTSRNYARPTKASEYKTKAMEEQYENYEQDFIRGSTVSQSFIKNVKGTGRGKTTYEKNVYQVTKSPSSNPISVGRNERKLKAKSMGFDELSERYTRHTGDGSSGSRTRARSNERRKSAYAPNSLDRAEL